MDFLLVWEANKIKKIDININICKKSIGRDWKPFPNQGYM